jgi:hypothetical protein
MSAAVSLLAACLFGGAACIFTDPINVPPTIQIDAPSQLLRGETAEFRAVATDDHGTPTVTWALVSGACPADRPPASWPAAKPEAVGERYVVAATDTRARFCLWAFATDQHRASRAAVFDADPTNRPPVARLDVVTPEPEPAGTFALFSTFHLSAGASSDPDKDDLRFDWRFLRQPSGSAAALAACDAPADVKARCFNANVRGEYLVALKVTDPLGAETETTKTLTVRDDQAPCIVETAPTFELGQGERLVHDRNLEDTFQVRRVQDDGDPWPGGRPEFRWFVARGAEAFVRFENDLSTFSLPARQFGVGELVRIRLEVADRNRDTISRSLLSCAADLCELSPGSGCFQRVTWTVEYR